MRRNYPAFVSLVAFSLAVGLPAFWAVIRSDSFEAVTKRQGPGVLWLTVFWVIGWALLGVIFGSIGIYWSRRGVGGRLLSITGLALNGLFLLLQLRNI